MSLEAKTLQEIMYRTNEGGIPYTQKYVTLEDYQVLSEKAQKEIKEKYEEGLETLFDKQIEIQDLKEKAQKLEALKDSILNSTGIIIEQNRLLLIRNEDLAIKVVEAERIESEIVDFRAWLIYWVQNAPVPSDEAVDLIFETFIKKFPEDASL